MTLVVFGDFTDPLSRIASRRADVLVLGGVELQWRAVAAHRSLRVVSSSLDESAQQALSEVSAWHREHALPGESTWLPEPTFVPCPDPAVNAFAEAAAAGVAHHMRHELFADYWRRGLDIGNPLVLRERLVLPLLHAASRSDVLRHSGGPVAVSGGPITSQAWSLRGEWREQWQELGSPELPALVEGARVEHGRGALRRLGELIAERHLSFTDRGEENPFALPMLPVAARRLSIARPGLRDTWWDGWRTEPRPPARLTAVVPDRQHT